MPTERPRVTITVTEEQLKEIEAYRFGKKMKNQTQAILSLVRAGLDEIERREKNGIKNASALEETDAEELKAETIDLFREVLGRAGLLDENHDLSDDDLDFLKAIFMAIKAHFNQRKKGRD